MNMLHRNKYLKMHRILHLNLWNSNPYLYKPSKLSKHSNLSKLSKVETLEIQNAYFFSFYNIKILIFKFFKFEIVIKKENYLQFFRRVKNFYSLLFRKFRITKSFENLKLVELQSFQGFYVSSKLLRISAFFFPSD